MILIRPRPDHLPPLHYMNIGILLRQGALALWGGLLLKSQII